MLIHADGEVVFFFLTQDLFATVGTAQIDFLIWTTICPILDNLISMHCRKYNIIKKLTKNQGMHTLA